jgi:hypothetical protein
MKRQEIRWMTDESTSPSLNEVQALAEQGGIGSLYMAINGSIYRGHATFSFLSKYWLYFSLDL